MGNMREISIQECQAVFGGSDTGEPEPEIVVTGTKKYESASINVSLGSFSGFSFAGGGDFSLPDGWSLGTAEGLISSDATPLEYDPERDGTSGVAVDEDGDGEFDAIVVNPTSPSGYFFGVGLSVNVFGGILHYDINGERWYLTPEAGFGTPVQVQIGYSDDVAGFLGGPSVTALSGNPGVPVVSYNGQNVNLSTHVMGTPSVGVGYGMQVPTLGEVMLKIEQDARILRDGMYGWIENGSPGTHFEP